MFEEVARRQKGERVTRRAAFLFGSIFVEAASVALLVVAGGQIRTAARSEVVEVRLVQPAAQRPSPRTAPPLPAKRPSSNPEKTEGKKAPLAAMIQPKGVPDEIQPPDPNEPEEYEDGDGDGVVGGVAGGAASPGAVPREAPEAPRYVTNGFRPPRLVTRTCLAENLHLPPQLLAVVSGSLTVKFPIYSDGAVGSIEILTPVPDPRISEAIRHAITTCEWVPGSDAQGRPTALWVIQPFRFAD